MIDWRDAALPVETVPQISAWDLHTLLESGEAVVVDVREPFEWLEGPLQGAMHPPMFEAGAPAPPAPPPPPEGPGLARGPRPGPPNHAPQKAAARPPGHHPRRAGAP